MTGAAGSVRSFLPLSDSGRGRPVSEARNTFYKSRRSTSSVRDCLDMDRKRRATSALRAPAARCPLLLSRGWRLTSWRQPALFLEHWGVGIRVLVIPSTGVFLQEGWSLKDHTRRHNLSFIMENVDPRILASLVVQGGICHLDC